MGPEPGVAETCEKLGLVHFADVERNEYGTPLVSSVFRIGQAKASHSVVCYINSDIMLTSDFMSAISNISVKMAKFLIVGQRTDVDINEPWNFDAADWEADLKSVAAQRGKLHDPSGIDYFCFPRGMYDDIPPFAIGRLAWDNWLVWKARTQGFPIIDVAKAVIAVHQNHDYAPDKLRKLDAQTVASRKQKWTSDSKLWFDKGWFELGPEAQRNVAQVPEGQNLNIWAATWAINHSGELERRRLTLRPAYLWYQVKCVLPIYWPMFGRALRWLRNTAKLLRRYIRNRAERAL